MTNSNVEIQFLELPINLIDGDPEQPRVDFDDPPLNELAANIQATGVVEPIHVTRVGDRFQLLNGGRRLKASVIAGKTSIPAIVFPEPADEAERLLHQVLSNAHREDLNAMELCEAFKRLMALAKINATELARKVSKSKTYVSNVLSLDGLSEKAKQLIRSGKIGLAKGALLARLNEEALEKALKDLEDGDVGREELERSTAKKTGKANDKPVRRIAFETPKATVSLQGKSKISMDELIDLLQNLIRSCKRARKDNLDLPTLAAIFRDQAAVQNRGAS